MEQGSGLRSGRRFFAVGDINLPLPLIHIKRIVLKSSSLVDSHSAEGQHRKDFDSTGIPVKHAGEPLEKQQTGGSYEKVVNVR